MVAGAVVLSAAVRIEVATFANLIAAATDSGGSGAITAYGPIIVATGGLIMALVAALGRRDKRAVDQLTTVDAWNNTALKGLSEAYDRNEAERARWQERAEMAEARIEECEQRAEEAEHRARLAEAELARLRPKKRAPRRSPPAD